MNNCIYRFINKNHEIIYIGKAKDLEKRLKGHSHLSKECYEERAYIEYAEFETEHEMDFAERYYIQKLNPKYNTILADRQISFNCEDLDNKIFNIYEVNQYVVEKTYEQIELLNKEDLIIELNTSIIELIGTLTIYKSEEYRNKTKEQRKNTFKSYDKLKKWNDNCFREILKYEKNLNCKYYLLDIRTKFKDKEVFNLEKDEYILDLMYKEKYKKEYKKIDLIIRCK